MKLILMPGLDGTGKLFKPLIDALGNEVTTHIISYPSETHLTYDKLSEYLKNQLIDIDEQIVLLAESYSGPVALKLLKDPLPNIKAVIFSATFCESPKSLLIFLGRILPLAQILKIPMPIPFIKFFCLGSDISSETVNIFKKTIAKSNFRVLAKRIVEISRLKLFKPEMGKIPCCYIQAQMDKLVPSDCFDSFKKIIPQIELIKIKGPHFILQSRPHECKEIIAKFINKTL